MSIQKKIHEIVRILRSDRNLTEEIHYIEQISWVFLLKFVSDLEDSSKICLQKDSIEKKYKWNYWASTKNPNGGSFFLENSLINFIENELFIYYGHLKFDLQESSILRTLGDIFSKIKNRISKESVLRDILTIVDSINMSDTKDLETLANSYENLLEELNLEGNKFGPFYTPRAITEAIVRVIEPQLNETIFDGAAGSGGFLVQAYKYLEKMNDNSLIHQTMHTSKNNVFCGNEINTCVYVIGATNLLLHNIINFDFQQKDSINSSFDNLKKKYDIVMSNPPFGGKLNEFTNAIDLRVPTNSLDLLFTQYYMDSLNHSGRGAIIVPDGFLSSNSNPQKEIKKILLEEYNLHTILRLPSGSFLPYSGLKTSVLFFNKKKCTQDIWYYECNPDRKLTRNTTLTYDDLNDFVLNYQSRPKNLKNAWTKNVDDLDNYNLGSNNLRSINETSMLLPQNIFREISKTNENISLYFTQIKNIMNTTSLLENRDVSHWHSDKLGSLVDCNTGYSGKILENEEGYKLVKIGDINDGKIDLSKVNSIKLEDAKASQYILEEDDLLIARVGATLGKTALVKRMDGKLIFGSNLYRMKTDENKIMPNFLYFFFQTKAFQSYIEDNSFGTAQPSINMSSLLKMPISYPSLPEQESILKEISNLDKSVGDLLAEYFINEANLISLRDSCLANIFNK